MKSLGQQAARDLWLLSLTAGSADAVGYLGLNRVFTSNMTGNLVLLGINLGEGQFISATRILFVMSIFILGVCLGAWLGRNVPEREWPTLGFRLIGMEKIVLLLFAFGWFLLVDRMNVLGGHALLALLAVAMGLQSAALNRLSAPGVVTTAVTGTLTAFAIGTMNLFFLSKAQVAEKMEGRARVQFQLYVILLYCAGAALAGWLIMSVPHLAGCFPFLAAVFVALGRPKS